MQIYPVHYIPVNIPTPLVIFLKYTTGSTDVSCSCLGPALSGRVAMSTDRLVELFLQ